MDYFYNFCSREGWKIFDGDPNDLSNTKLTITSNGRYQSWKDEHFIDCVKEGNTLRQLAYEIHYNLLVFDKNTDKEHIFCRMKHVVPGVLYICNGHGQFKEYDNYISEDGTVYYTDLTEIEKSYAFLQVAMMDLFQEVVDNRKKQRCS